MWHDYTTLIECSRKKILISKLLLSLGHKYTVLKQVKDWEKSNDKSTTIDIVSTIESGKERILG